MKNKKPFKDTKFANFLNKAKNILPELSNVGLSVLSGNYVGALKEVGNVITKNKNKNEEAKKLAIEFEMFKSEFEKECFEKELEDRKDARELYKDDSLIQKVFSIVFLIGYGFLSWFLLNILMGTSEIPKLAETMITMIWTGTSTKLNTIIDFFFGGSVEK